MPRQRSTTLLLTYPSRTPSRLLRRLPPMVIRAQRPQVRILIRPALSTRHPVIHLMSRQPAPQPSVRPHPLTPMPITRQNPTNRQRPPRRQRTKRPTTPPTRHTITPGPPDSSPDAHSADTRTQPRTTPTSHASPSPQSCTSPGGRTTPSTGAETSPTWHGLRHSSSTGATSTT